MIRSLGNRLSQICGWVLLFISCICSAPITSPNNSSSFNTTAQTTTAFVKEPSGRGTIGLLNSCISTLILCVWTAIHMNIPPPGLGRRRQIWFRVWWALVAIFAPKVVLLRALFQWHTARNLRDMRNEILDQQQANSPQENMATGGHWHEKNKREYWTLEHGFFAVMGGFEVTVREGDQWILDDGRTVAPRGILELARLNKLPIVDRDIISGRGKADLLTKVLVVSQVTWMLVQAIGRK